MENEKEKCSKITMKNKRSDPKNRLSSFLVVLNDGYHLVVSLNGNLLVIKIIKKP